MKRLIVTALFLIPALASALASYWLFAERNTIVGIVSAIFAGVFGFLFMRISFNSYAIPAELVLQKGQQFRLIGLSLKVEESFNHLSFERKHEEVRNRGALIEVRSGKVVYVLLSGSKDSLNSLIPGYHYRHLKHGMVIPAPVGAI